MWCMSKRLSITLEDSDEQALQRFAEPGSPEQRVLTSWAERHHLSVGTGSGKTATILRLLVRAGVDALEEDVQADGYAQLAQDLSQEEREETREARGRYARRTEATAGE